MGERPRPDPIGDASVLARHPAVATAEIDGEGILYDERTNAVHQLNGPALAVWLAFDGTRTLAEVATDLAETFGADPRGVTADVLAAARDLVGRSLLTEASRLPAAKAVEAGSPLDAADLEPPHG